MTIERTSIRVIHLDGTSETDRKPVAQAISELEFKLAPLPAEQRDSAVLVGWRGNHIEVEVTLTDIEYRDAILRDVRNKLAAGVTRGGLSLEEQAALLQALPY